MIAWLITSRIGRALGAAVALFVAIVTFGAYSRQKGRDEAENDAVRDSAERQEEGREAVQDIRRADRDELTRRLREADDKW